MTSTGTTRVREVEIQLHETMKTIEMASTEIQDEVDEEQEAISSAIDFDLEEEHGAQDSNSNKIATVEANLKQLSAEVIVSDTLQNYKRCVV